MQSPRGNIYQCIPIFWEWTQFECHDLCTLLYISDLKIHTYTYIQIHYIFHFKLIQFQEWCSFVYILFEVRGFYILRIQYIYIHILHLKRKFPEGQFLDKTSNLISCPSSKVNVCIIFKKSGQQVLSDNRFWFDNFV